MSVKKTICLVILGIILVSGFIAVIIKLSLLSSEASAVTIIGGADGPTTIYIVPSVNWKSLLFCLLLDLFNNKLSNPIMVYNTTN